MSNVPTFETGESHEFIAPVEATFYCQGDAVEIALADPDKVAFGQVDDLWLFFDQTNGSLSGAAIEKTCPLEENRDVIVRFFGTKFFDDLRQSGLQGQWTAVIEVPQEEQAVVAQARRDYFRERQQVLGDRAPQ